jgi:hypothetical protein
MIEVPRVLVIGICIILMIWIYYMERHISRLEKYLRDSNKIMIDTLSQLSLVFKSMSNESNNIESEREDEENGDNGYLDVRDNSKT